MQPFTYRTCLVAAFVSLFYFVGCSASSSTIQGASSDASTSNDGDYVSDSLHDAALAADVADGSPIPTDVQVIQETDPENPPNPDNPLTCEEAIENKSYIGCDYWPTVTANPDVHSDFDFAVVVSNTGESTANVRLTGNGQDITVNVDPGQLQTIYLPWVPALKMKSPQKGEELEPRDTVRVNKGAYHLQSSHPVTVYQFNPLEYKGEGGPPGKNWSKCKAELAIIGGCFSFSNDASLLLPSSAMTGNYRAAGPSGWEFKGSNGNGDPIHIAVGAFVTITATMDGTKITFLSAADTAAGGGLKALKSGEKTEFELSAGDVMQIMGMPKESAELSGSIIAANKPVQVITGHPCRFMPSDKWACDHVEESMFPAETLGKNYVVTTPAHPRSDGTKTVGHIVRIIGNFDDTDLHFDPPISAPGISGGKAIIKAGQVIDLGIVNSDFRVWSESHSFIVTSFLISADLVDPQAGFTPSKGDPAQTLAAGVEQYRNEYVFLAPQDYDTNFVNIIGPSDAAVTVDEVEVKPEWFNMIGSSGLGVVRWKLSSTGVHHLKAQKPVGIQVYGYGSYTSFQYPGGLNLKVIAPPPIVK